MKQFTKTEVAALLHLLGITPDDQVDDFASMLSREVGSTGNAALLTQTGGLFSTFGLEPDVISTHVRTQGIGSILPPPIPSNSDDPRYPVFSGYGAEEGNQPTYPCEDAPSGTMYAGSLTSQFGRIPKNTNTIEIDSLLHSGGRGITTNLRLLGQIFGDSMMPSTLSQDQILDLVVKAEMVGSLVQMERSLSKLNWIGTPTNNTAGKGYKEYKGLDYQIITGHVDADGGGAMPNMDSYLDSFGLNNVKGTGADIVSTLSYALYYLETLADQTGISPVSFVICMRSDLWHEICEIWPSRYLSQNSFSQNGTQLLVINDDVNVKLRDAMKMGKFIDVYGKRYAVVIDDGIYEKNSTNTAGIPKGSYASPIYILPTSYAGSNQALYVEYIDYSGVNGQIAPLGAASSHLQFWSDNGRFLWNLTQKRFCFDLQVKVEPRLILRTPQLAGKISDIAYTPKRKTRDAYPGSPYYVSGGVGGSPADVLATLISNAGDYGRRVL